MNLTTKKMIAGATIAFAGSTASAASAIATETTEYGLAYVPKVTVTCNNGQASPKIVDLRKLDLKAGETKVAIDLNSANSAADNNNFATYPFTFANCNNVILNPNAGTATVKGTSGNDDVLVGDVGFANVAGNGGNDRVFINSKISDGINVTQNGSYVSISFKNSAGVPSKVNIRDVGTVCGTDFSATFTGNNAATLNYNGACVPGFAQR